MMQKYRDEIQRRRKIMGITLAEMAFQLDMSEMTLGCFLNGKRNINAEYFLKICDFVGLELWKGNEDE